MHLILHLTEQCNLRCRYCYAAPHRDAAMDFTVAEAALRLAVADHRVRYAGQRIGVLFFGGEPLLQRELMREIVRFGQQLGQETGIDFSWKMATNGLLLDEEFFHDPLTRDIFVTLSHDGIAAAHDAHRVDAAGHGSFARLAPVVALLLRHRPQAPVVTVVNPDTLPHYAASIRWLFERGFRRFLPSLNYGAAWTDAEMVELERQYRLLAMWYTDVLRAGNAIDFAPFDGKITAHITGSNCPRERCDLGVKEISVAPDGSIYPCLQFVNDQAYRIGDVATGIDTAHRAQLLSRSRALPSACRSCAYANRCDNFCGCLNKQSTGRINAVSPVLCAHERTLIPIADDIAQRLYHEQVPMFMRKFYSDSTQ